MSSASSVVNVICNLGHYGASYELYDYSFVSFGGTYFRTSGRKIIFEAKLIFCFGRPESGRVLLFILRMRL